ncbi:MAG TPA: 6-phosphofructokinase, partial [Vulgatibacter sp.]
MFRGRIHTAGEPALQSNPRRALRRRPARPHLPPREAPVVIGAGAPASGRLSRVSLVKVAVLTGGGDCPGLNAVIRAIVRKGVNEYGHAIVGFRDGWRGPMEQEYEELTI